MDRPAALNQLDEYVGSFYEEALEAKIAASKKILELFQDFGNLEALLEHGRRGVSQTVCCRC